MPSELLSTGECSAVLSKCSALVRRDGFDFLCRYVGEGMEEGEFSEAR